VGHFGVLTVFHTSIMYVLYRHHVHLYDFTHSYESLTTCPPGLSFVVSFQQATCSSRCLGEQIQHLTSRLCPLHLLWCGALPRHNV
jgi:hypothetical protein